jgi:hypothetical protein
MLPDDWRKQIEDAAREANNAANEQNRHLHENLSTEMNTVTNQLRRYNDTEDRERPKKQCRENWTIVALFAAAIGTGALAVFTAWQAYETHEAFGPIQESASAADRQVTAMRRQLDEMRAQRLVNIAQTSAAFVRDTAAHAMTDGGKLAAVGDRIVEYSFSPFWKNTGNTEARAFRAWFDLKVYDIGPTIPRHLSSKDCPALDNPDDPLPNERIIQRDGVAIQLAKSLPVDDLTATMGKTATKFILMWGHMEVKDIYFPETVPHGDDWCVSVIPADLRQQSFSYPVLSEVVK